MTPQSSINIDEEVVMVGIDESNKRDRSNTSFESVKDDEKSPKTPKKKKVKMQNNDYTMIY